MDFFVGEPANHFHNPFRGFRRVTSGFQDGRDGKDKGIDEFRLGQANQGTAPKISAASSTLIFETFDAGAEAAGGIESKVLQ
jgi:hypothetical protein